MPQVRRKLKSHKFSPEITKGIQGLCRQTDNYHGLLALVQDALIIAAAITLAIWYPLLLPVSLIVIGSRQRALDTLLHEAVHLTLARNRALNILIGCFAGWSVFHTYHDYRKSHVKEHHVNLGDSENDPDTKNYTSQKLFETNPQTIFRQHLLPKLLGLKTLRVIHSLLSSLLISIHNGKKSLREVILFLLFWSLTISFFASHGILGYFFLFWLVPYFTVFQAIEWLTEVAEHFPLTKLYDSALMITRNRRGNTFERLVTGIHSEDWHLVHHIHPGIPFWSLRAAHELMLQDKTYDEANQYSGGLFTKGPRGEPSIISLLEQQLSNAQRSSERANWGPTQTP